MTSMANVLTNLTSNQHKQGVLYHAKHITSNINDKKQLQMDKL